MGTSKFLMRSQSRQSRRRLPPCNKGQPVEMILSRDRFKVPFRREDVAGDVVDPAKSDRSCVLDNLFVDVFSRRISIFSNGCRRDSVDEFFYGSESPWLEEFRLAAASFRSTASTSSSARFFALAVNRRTISI